MTAIEQTARGVRLALRDGELLNGKLDRTDFANQVAALGSVEGVAQPAAGKSPEVALALLQLRSRGGLPPRVLRRLREYVEAHLVENISLQMLASTAGLSMSYFARAFKQSEGVPPHEYLVRCRVRRAQELLATTDLPLSEIARIAGFSDQSHCTRRFRERVGITPSSYRRSMR